MPKIENTGYGISLLNEHTDMYTIRNNELLFDRKNAVPHQVTISHFVNFIHQKRK
jgi:hypothetical protein